MAAGPDRVTGIEHAFREEWGAVVATLARRLGDLQAAEDATAEAFATASVAWARDGVPPNPGGWLTVTAWRKAVDTYRASGRSTAVDPTILNEVTEKPEETVMPEPLGDDRLGLAFACCHPALAVEARVALTLRFVAGLATRDIAAAFVVPEATLAQRLVRAKRKIRETGIRFTVPSSPAHLAERLSSVRMVVYLVFNEGFAASAGAALVRDDLCDEAIWLGRLLRSLLPADPETAGLLALMLLHSSRRAARLAPDGRPVPLAEQDRALWNRTLIEEASRVLDDALELHSPGPYQLQAAIAALHASAGSYESTDWPQIALLYRALARLDPSPVVEVNRAVAVGMADGPLAGLAVLAPVLASGALSEYAPLHAAHGFLLDEAGDPGRARGAWGRAAETSGNTAVRDELLRRHEID
ncbi:MAG: RNA polymerase subunit sigma-24 [Actinomycetota bacterium]|nr:RNA polymerase subunit sigma-24 [Actinomycetota bacterium]